VKLVHDECYRIKGLVTESRTMRGSIIYNMCDILRIYKVINVLDVLIG
jgi:hypothetical protein